MQNNDDSSKVGVDKVGTYYAEKWSSTYIPKSSLSQDVCGLTSGLYKLTVKAFAVWNWSGDGITGINLVCGYNNISINNGQEYELYAVVGNGYLNVGIEVDSTNNSDWCGCDDWSLVEIKNGSIDIYNDYLTKISNQGKLLYQSIDYNNLGYVDEFGLDVYNKAITTTNSAQTTTDIINAVRYWEQYIVYSSNIYTSASQSNINIIFDNPSFEDNFTGWTNNGFEIQTNDSPSYAGWDKNGTNYAQVWNAVACPNSTITHSFNTNTSGMSGGYYEIEVKGHALYEWSYDNITGVHLYTTLKSPSNIVGNAMPMTKGQVYKTHILIGANASRLYNKNIFWPDYKIGVQINNTNANYVAFDDVKIYKRDIDIAYYKLYFNKLKNEINNIIAENSSLYQDLKSHFDIIIDDLDKHDWEYSKLTYLIMIYKMEDLLGYFVTQLSLSDKWAGEVS